MRRMMSLGTTCGANQFMDDDDGPQFGGLLSWLSESPPEPPPPLHDPQPDTKTLDMFPVCRRSNASARGEKRSRHMAKKDTYTPTTGWSMAGDGYRRMEDETSTEMATGQRRRDRNRMHVVCGCHRSGDLRKLDDACVWALFAIVVHGPESPPRRTDRLRIEANVTRE